MANYKATKKEVDFKESEVKDFEEESTEDLFEGLESEFE